MLLGLPTCGTSEFDLKKLPLTPLNPSFFIRNSKSSRMCRSRGRLIGSFNLIAIKKWIALKRERPIKQIPRCMSGDVACLATDRSYAWGVRARCQDNRPAAKPRRPAAGRRQRGSLLDGEGQSPARDDALVQRFQGSTHITRRGRACRTRYERRDRD